jgi:hypothetical protein
MMKINARNVIRPAIVVVITIALFLIVGCNALRFAPSEQQKQNAWLHNRTTSVAAEKARAEQTSAELQALTKLSEKQSRAFTAYCGLPREFPQAESSSEILAQSNWQLADTALAQSVERPDPWQVADSFLEVAIGVSALFGGIYGTRAVRFLKDAHSKSQALKEIVEGNERFKEQNETQAQAFKAAHENQSPDTRQLVVQLRT